MLIKYANTSLQPGCNFPIDNWRFKYIFPDINFRFLSFWYFHQMFNRQFIYFVVNFTQISLSSCKTFWKTAHLTTKIKKGRERGENTKLFHFSVECTYLYTCCTPFEKKEISVPSYFNPQHHHRNWISAAAGAAHHPSKNEPLLFEKDARPTYFFFFLEGKVSKKTLLQFMNNGEFTPLRYLGINSCWLSHWKFSPSNKSFG